MSFPNTEILRVLWPGSFTRVPLHDPCTKILRVPSKDPRIQRSWKSPQARGPRIGTVNADTTSPQHTTYNLLIFSSIPGWENATSWQTFLGLAHVPQVGAYWILDQGGQGAVQTGHSTAQEVPMTLVSASRSVTKDVPVTVRRSRTWAIQNGLKAEGFSQQQMGYETNKNRDVMDNRRKFRSQTSDNMDRWKAEQGRGREKRKIRREKSRRERVRRKKMQMREKVGKSRNTVFFQWFGAPEGRKVGSLKRRVRSQLARWEMKNCTPLWREAHFEVKMYKTPQRRTTFGSWDVEKVHAVVARSIFWSQKC